MADTWFDPSLFYVEFSVDKGTLGLVFFLLVRLSPVNICPPLFHTYSSIFHRRYIVFETESVVKQHTLPPVIPKGLATSDKFMTMSAQLLQGVHSTIKTGKHCSRGSKRTLHSSISAVRQIRIPWIYILLFLVMRSLQNVSKQVA